MSDCEWLIIVAHSTYTQVLPPYRFSTKYMVILTWLMHSLYYILYFLGSWSQCQCEVFLSIINSRENVAICIPINQLYFLYLFWTQDWFIVFWLQGYNDDKKYIAAQGPTDANIIDFWFMIWQQNIGKIVMTTRLFEANKVSLMLLML